MGQTQSQESESSSPPSKAEPDDQDFDISKIPDDRDQALSPNFDVDPNRNPAPDPDEVADMAKRSDRKYISQPLAVKQDLNAPRKESNKRRRIRRQSSNNTSNDAASEGPKRKSSPFSKSTSISPENRPLKDTEPETYHIYATSDSSDAEGAGSLAPYGGIHTFTPVNGAGQKINAPVPDVSVNRLEEGDLAPEQAKVSHTEPAPEIPATTRTRSTVGGNSGPPITQLPQLDINDTGRFRCPFADVHNCKLTFSTAKAATRHANVHTTSFVCVVCKKQMSRKDTLANHMKLHSAQQIVSAEASSKSVEDAESEEPDHPHPAQPNVEAHTEVEIGEPPEEDPMEFTTPQEKLDAKEHSHHAEVEPRPEAQERLEAGMSKNTPDEDVAEDASDQQSTSPPSVFDEAEDIVVKETPMPKGNLKRKRDVEDGPGHQRPSPERTRKRRKGSPSSPPTSVPPNETAKPDSMKTSVRTDVLQSRQITDKIVPRLQKRQASMDGWAQIYIPGSGLRHPTLNPKSPPSHPVARQIEVVIPRTSQAGPSSMESKKKGATIAEREMSADHEGSEAHALEGLGRRRPRKAVYVTSKGKTRAEPDVDYSTPTKDPINGELDESDGDGDTEPVDIATTVAKRTFPVPKAEVRSHGQEDDDDSDFDVDQTTDSENEVTISKLAKNADKVTKAPKAKRSSNGNSLDCARCHRRFASSNLLNNHLRKPSAHIGLLKCQECSEEFWASTALAEHEKDTGHGKGNGLQGRTGAFSQAEVDKLNRWRDRFCEYHNISRIQFNDMMTDTMVRDKGSSWNWPFIKRADFLKEYIGILPNRNKRSLLRYRERNFQNVEGSKNWTAEDDKDLVRLHKELGPKWAEIARRLTRTVDAVSQRWRHKLRYGEVETGEWSRAEDIKFRKILDELRHDSHGNELHDYHIPWNKVSERMGTRSAQQCSNHYRARHSIKERGTWIKIDALEKAPGSSRILTPSKMELRLSGKKAGSRTAKKGLSEEYVVDDDEDGDEAQDEGQGDGKAHENDKSTEHTPDEDTSSEHKSDAEADVEAENQSPSSAEDGYLGNRNPRPRIPVITKTPGKTLRSSQLFEQTQANTSALKPSQTSSRRARLQGSQERPSPNIPIQRRRLESRSPLQEIPVLENGDLALEEHEEEDDEAESRSEVSAAEESEDSAASQRTDEEPDATSADSADEDEDVPAGRLVGNEEAGTEDNDDDDNDDTADTDEDQDEDDGGDSDDNIDEETPSEDVEDEESVASVDNTSTFMDSINESAKRSRIRSSQVLGIGNRNGRKLHNLNQEDSDEE